VNNATSQASIHELMMEADDEILEQSLGLDEVLDEILAD
jgi:hypothetical protein